MTEPHVHCAACHRVIEQEYVADDGTRLPLPEPFMGTQFTPVPTAQGVQITPLSVPICPDCTKAMQAREAGPKLVVPHGLRTVQ